jgi:outer membrane cobalamin receptor
MKRYILSILIIIISFYDIKAQVDSIDINTISRSEISNLSYTDLLALPLEDLMVLANKLGISIDELLNMSMTTSSKTSFTPRETPGIVSVVTSEDIKVSGSRDLIDILQTIPGFNFGYDVDGVIGISSRGNWGHEGKVLILVDGQEFNEGMYTTMQFGNHVPVDQIEKIEIIRGPGSSLYGGYAELGVINITTKSAKAINGVEIYGTGGTYSDKISRTSAGLNYGKKMNDFEIDFKSFYANGTRSNIDFTDLYGDTYDMTDGYSDYQTVNMNLGLKFKDLSTRFIFDDYIPNATGYDIPERNRFHNLYGELKYNIKASDKFQITPTVNYKNQMPWWYSTEDWYYKKSYSQLKAEVDLVYQPTEKIDVIGGIVYKYDYAEDKDPDPEVTFYNGKKDVSFNTLSFYVQANLKTKFTNFFVGTRFDNHSEVGSSFSPRIGITKAYDKFHYKLLYSNAFRTPSFENINLNEDIEPETTNVIELELGYKLNDNMFITSNLFNIVINDPIIYVWDIDADEEYYFNQDKTGSRGLEFEYMVKYYKWSMNLGYSYYTAKDMNNVVPYQVEYPIGITKENLMKGSPQHKITLKGSYNLTENISFAPSLVYMSETYGFITSDLEQSKQDPVLLANAFLLFRNIGIKNLDLGIGIYNLLGSDYGYIQPYGDYELAEAMYPSSPREFTLKLNYKF